MASFNKITICGFLGRDAEQRFLPNGTAVSTFSIATTEKTKNGDVTTWFRVSLFGKVAETLTQYLVKGKQVYLDGRLRQTEYTDKDGNIRHSLEVFANDVQMLSPKGDAQPNNTASAVTDDDSESIPF